MGLTMAKVLLLLVAVVSQMLAQDSARSICPADDQIFCGANKQCIRLREVCDGSYDCHNWTDEDSELCKVWPNTCRQGFLTCTMSNSSKCMSVQEFCRLTKPTCKANIDLRICQMVLDNKLQKLQDIKLPHPAIGSNLWFNELLVPEFSRVLNLTMAHPRCPPLYTLVDGQCLSFLVIGNVSWSEARVFCNRQQGDLLSFNNITHFDSLRTYLRTAQITADFWIGGRYMVSTNRWTWVNNNTIEPTSLYWATRYDTKCQRRLLSFPDEEEEEEEGEEERAANHGNCYHYVQAPEQEARKECVALTYEHYYFMSDEDCLQRKSPLCVLSEPVAANTPLPP